MAEYFVEFTNGNNGNPGTQLLPWKTHDKVQSTVIAGDRVYFKRGETWVTNSWLVGSHQLIGGVTYDAYGSGERPRFKGAQTMTGWTLHSGSIYKATTTQAAGGSSETIWEDGVIGTRKTSLATVVAPRDFFLDDAADLLYYWASNGANPETHAMEFDRGSEGANLTGSNGTFRNFLLEFCASAGLGLNIFGQFTVGWIVENCLARNMLSSGFSQTGGGAGSSFVLDNCEIYNTSTFGLNLSQGVRDTTIRSMLIHDIKGHGANIAGSGAAPHNIIVEGGTTRDNDQDGLIFDNSVDGGVIQGLIAFNNGKAVNDRSGIKSFGKNVRIMRCLSYDNNTSFSSGHGIQLDYTPPSAQDNEISYCVCYGNANGGISITGSGHKLYNNVAAKNLTNGINLFAGSVGCPNLIMKNNILFDNGTNGRQLDVPGGFSISGSILDYNLYFDPDAHTNLVQWAGTMYATLASFRSATGQEAQGVEVDPLFVNAAAANFRVKPSSPCINAGTPVGLDRDFVGARIPQGKSPDMGSYEYVGWPVRDIAGHPSGLIRSVTRNATQRRKDRQ